MVPLSSEGTGDGCWGPNKKLVMPLSGDTVLSKPTCVALLPKTDADKSKVQPDESLLIILPNRLKLLVLGET